MILFYMNKEWNIKSYDKIAPKVKNDISVEVEYMILLEI